MDFVSEQSIFSREAREEREENIGSLFLWSVVIVILIGLNAFSWIFCMYVFGNPEVPFNYQLLTKLDKLDPIEGFDPVTAPRGKFNAARNLYLEYYDYTPEKLNPINGILKRLYLKNYLERDDVTFVSGSFKVESSRTLQSDDVFPHGLAVRLQAEEFPAAHVDLVLPMPADALVPSEHYRVGDLVQLEESATCAAVIHVQRLKEDNICFTAVPLVTRSFDTPAGSKITVDPPERLNLDTGQWPLSRGPELVANPVQSDEPAEADAENDGDAEGDDKTETTEDKEKADDA